MKNEPKFEYDAELGLATCTLFDKKYGKEYIGIAQCHDDDLDFANENTGCEIALQRASIELYKDMRDKAKIELASLKQLYYSMNKSKNYNKKSYEAKMLYRQIKIKESDVEFAKEILTYARNNLNDYLKAKENLYQKIRSRRDFMSTQDNNE